MKFFNFDWDDNILQMRTKIVLFSKIDSSEINLSTEEFAKYRKTIGKDVNIDINGSTTNLINYELIESSNKNSFRNFRDVNNKNVFKEDMIDSIKHNLYGHSWVDFLEATSTRELSKNTRIITARGHNPLSIYNAIKEIKQLGIIKNEIPIENIFPLSFHEKFKDIINLDISTRKKIIMKDIIEEILDNGYQEKSIGFSDDDISTINSIMDLMVTLKGENNKLSKIEISIYFTGDDKKRKIII